MPSTKVRVLVGATILVVFAVVLGYMINVADDESDRTWARLTYLFGTVEAIVFAVVGWLFGREVHREKAEEATTRAEKAETAADVAKATQADLEKRGLVLAEAVRARRGGGGPDEASLGGTRRSAPSGGGDELVALADDLFPRPG